jgi:hypothetical protein
MERLSWEFGNKTNSTFSSPLTVSETEISWQLRPFQSIKMTTTSKICKCTLAISSHYTYASVEELLEAVFSAHLPLGPIARRLV